MSTDTPEVVPKVENGAQEEEKVPVVAKAEEDPDLPPLDSSDEEDSDEPNEYQEDGFVVNSESDEDLPDVDSDGEAGKSGGRLKRLRKGGKRRHYQLEQEDLDLIAANQGLLPSSKLKKTAPDSTDPSAASSISVAKSSGPRPSRGAERGESTDNLMDDIESEGEVNSEDDDFLVDDDEDEEVDAATRKQKRKERRNRATMMMNYEQFEDATQIYNDEWLQDLFDPTGDGLFDDSEFAMGGPIRTGEEDKFAVLKKQYEPEALKELYLTEKDENIRLTDIPERFQQQYPNRRVPTDEEVMFEAQWISDQLVTSNSMVTDTSAITERVKDVLTFLLSSHYEVSFIEHYRKEFWAPLLSNTDLWRIAELDHQWHNIQVRKQVLMKALPKDEDVIAADLKLVDIRTRLEIASTEEAVQDLADFYTFHFGGGGPSSIVSSSANTSQKSAPVALEDVVGADEEVDVTEKPDNLDPSAMQITETKPKIPQQKRPVRADTRTLAKENHLNAFWSYLDSSPSQLALAIAGLSKTEESAHPPAHSSFDSPLTLAEAHIAPPFFATARSVVDGACMLFAAELSVHPAFRARVSQQFDLHAVVSTKATVQGKLYIDLNHPFANVRHLLHKPIWSFRGTTNFLTILKAVEEGLLQVSISLQKEHTDALITEMGAKFHLEALEMLSSGDKSSPSHQWAMLRRKILSEAIGAVIPKLVARAKAKLHRDATQVVLAQAEANVEKLIRAGPIAVPGPVTLKRASTSKRGRQHNLDEEVEMTQPLAAICVGDPAVSKEVPAMIVIIDDHGEIRDTLSILASLRVEDSIAIRELFRKHVPFAIAVGIDTPLAKKFCTQIQELANSFVAEEKELSISSIKTIPMPLDVANIFQTTKHAEKEFNASSFVTNTPEAGVLLRRCASIARRLLDPLLEISGLVTQQDHVLGLNLHPLQKHVNQHALRRHVDNAFVRVVSEVGVDVNRILLHPWMQHVLQFVPGLRPRKATSLLEGLIRGDARLDSRNQLKDSAEDSQLRPNEYLGPVVWDNAVAFLNVSGNDVVYIRDWNPLDGTRIHPVAYAIAKKIGDDLSASGHIQTTDNFVSAISRDPTLLRHVDLTAMIEKLRSKQVYKELTVRALVEELKSPFADPRVFVETSMSSLFDLVVGKGILDIGMVVTVRTTFLDRAAQTWEVTLPNFVTGSISTLDAPDELRRGQTIQAQIIGVDKELFKCQLTCNITSSKWKAEDVKDRDLYLAPEPEDRSDSVFGSVPKPSLVKRTFQHRHFANKTMAEVEETLAPKSVGAYLIHPTTRKDLLTITFKFYFDTFAHISVKELPNGGGLEVENQTYENIDDLVVRFMEPMLMNVQELAQHSCFKLLNKQDMTAAIQQEKRNNPKRAPYNIAPSQEKPGFFVLYYIPGTQTVSKEMVRITPDGFKYRSILHKSVNRLIAYFKQHYNDPSYLARLRSQQQPATALGTAPAYSGAATAYGQWAPPQYMSESYNY